MAFPVSPVVMPAALAGTTNGKLPPEELTLVGSPGRPTARGQILAVNAWSALAADVLEHFNLTLTVTSSGDAYRSYSQQVATFLSRYQTTPIKGRPTKVWNGVTYWQKPNTAMAAVPGTSNHGWGLAFDTCYWVNGGILGITARMDCFNWMLVNAWRFGMCWEAQSEAWHIRYYKGDAVPQAVTDYLAPPPVVLPVQPPLAPFPQGDEMLVGIFECTHNGGHGIKYQVYTSGKKLWIGDVGMWEGTQNLLRLSGRSADVQTIVDPGLFAAMGRVEGVNDPVCDEYGVKVR